ncbi:MAG: hypothetical protein R2716_13735 [Microthrixaceae bacterium]
MVEGPRMTAGMNALLTAAGGTAGRLIPDQGTLGYAHVVRERDEMVRTVRQQIKYGADWIKIHVTGSLPTSTSELTVWSADELRAVTETAHALDTPTIAHCRSAGSTRLAAEAGVDLILHASFIDRPAWSVIEQRRQSAPVHLPREPGGPRSALVGARAAQVDLFRGEIEATAHVAEGPRRGCAAAVRIRERVPSPPTGTGATEAAPGGKGARPGPRSRRSRHPQQGLRSADGGGFRRGGGRGRGCRPDRARRRPVARHPPARGSQRAAK